MVILFNIDFDRFLAVRLPVFGECNGAFSQWSNTNLKFNLKHFIAFNFITTAQLYKSTKCFVQNFSFFLLILLLYFLVILFNIDFDRFLAVRLPVFGECNGVFSQLSNTNFKFNLKHFIAFNFITTAQLYKSTKCFVQNSIAKVQKLVKNKISKMSNGQLLSCSS